MHSDIMELCITLPFLNTPPVCSNPTALTHHYVHLQSKSSQCSHSAHKASRTRSHPARTASKGRNCRGWNGTRSAADRARSSASWVNARTIRRRRDGADNQSGRRRHL